MRALKWIKRRFIQNEEDNNSPDDKSTSSGEEYFDVDEDDLTSWEGVDDVSSGFLGEEEEWTEVEANLEIPDALLHEDAQIRGREPFASPLTRSRSTSSASNSTLNTPSAQPQQQQQQHHISCNSCHSCLVGKYKTNPFTEIQILNGDMMGHTDIIRQILPLGDEDDRDAFYRRHSPFLVASTGDDGAIIIWDVHSGRKQMILNGHRLRVTCMIKIEHERRLLVSGGCDKQIKIWNLEDGKCINTLAKHRGSVRCIVQLEGDRFCSGGNDPELCIWDIDGNLLGSIERGEDESKNLMANMILIFLRFKCNDFT
jgi:WD40 repeat protein